MQKQLIQADQLASQLLLGSKWAPVTNTLSFINVPLEEAAKVWHEWNQSKAQNKDDALMIEATGTLEEQFARLVPLDSGGRHLFLETKNPEWTAAVNNSVSGPDLSSMLYFRYSQALGDSHGDPTLCGQEELSRVPGKIWCPQHHGDGV